MNKSLTYALGFWILFCSGTDFVLADGFEPVGARALFREMGVSLGPGYHNPPCVPHLRQHYDMAVRGYQLPAHTITPLYLGNKFNSMSASRFVPSHPAPQAAIPRGYAAGYSGWENTSAPQLMGNGLLHLEGNVSQISDSGVDVQREATTHQVLPDNTPDDHGSSLNPHARDEDNALREIDSPFEAYSPKSTQTRRTDNDDTDMSGTHDGQFSPGPASTLPQPKTGEKKDDDSVWNHDFDEVEIEDGLAPVAHPLQQHPRWAEQSGE